MRAFFSLRFATSHGFSRFFLLVGFGVLFLRIDDPYAWLLSPLFVCFTGQQASKMLTREVRAGGLLFPNLRISRSFRPHRRHSIRSCPPFAPSRSVGSYPVAPQSLAFRGRPPLRHTANPTVPSCSSPLLGVRLFSWVCLCSGGFTPPSPYVAALACYRRRFSRSQRTVLVILGASSEEAPRISLSSNSTCLNCCLSSASANDPRCRGLFLSTARRTLFPFSSHSM